MLLFQQLSFLALATISMAAGLEITYPTQTPFTNATGSLVARARGTHICANSININLRKSSGNPCNSETKTFFCEDVAGSEDPACGVRDVMPSRPKMHPTECDHMIDLILTVEALEAAGYCQIMGDVLDLAVAYLEEWEWNANEVAEKTRELQVFVFSILKDATNKYTGSQPPPYATRHFDTKTHNVKSEITLAFRKGRDVDQSKVRRLTGVERWLLGEYHQEIQGPGGNVAQVLDNNAKNALYLPIGRVTENPPGGNQQKEQDQDATIAAIDDTIDTYFENHPNWAPNVHRHREYMRFWAAQVPDS